MAIGNSHANSILGIRVESFYCAVAVTVQHLLEDFLSFHLHAHAVFQLVLQVLVRKVDEAEEELTVRGKQVEQSVL